MRTRRRTYTAISPASLLSPHSETHCSSPSASATRKRKLQSVKARGDLGLKKKCITGLWDLNLPSELLQEILSRLGLKANIRASVVCKTWFEAAVSVRKLQPRPWLFYPLDESSPTGSLYIFIDPLRCQTYQDRFPELKNHKIFYSRDGWLLVRNYYYPSAFFLNPFTRERINLPWGLGHYLAFSVAPTSSSCLVISLTQQCYKSSIVIDTWRPGETVWTTHRFENQLPECKWTLCVFSNGMFYWLSAYGYLGVFDPSRETWNILPVKPCPADFARPVLMTEHEGDIYVMYTSGRSYQPVFKLNLERKIWEEKRDFGGLTVFSSYPASLTRAGLSAEERNIIYERLSLNYSFSNDKSFFRPPWRTFWSRSIAWVDPPHNVNL